MPISASLLDGTSSDPKVTLNSLKEELLPKAVRQMNRSILPREVPLFPTDKLPTNQRNLTDYRTRIGTLLEYSLGQAINQSLPAKVRGEGLVLTNVVANQFPDLAFRTNDGKLGIRFEVKAVQAVAEEPSANFSTLIKDIRKGTDFVVVMIWDWKQHRSQDLKFPHISSFFAMDAYHLAQMRDCHWLNAPPKSLQSARQGFDLTYAINARGNAFNEEEGNLGKLMRIFSEKDENLLSQEVRESETLKTYYEFTKAVIRSGLTTIARDMASAAEEKGASVTSVSDELPVRFVVQRDNDKILVMGDRNMPTKKPSVREMSKRGATRIIILNYKFDWRVYNADWKKLGEGNKADGVVEWMKGEW